LIPLEEGGYLADTPGLREFGLFSVEAAELTHYFIEYQQYIGECRFPNCTHDHEPQCRIRELVEEDVLSIERYESYINILRATQLGNQDVGR
jgi:ribosome biogenesis GTPase